MRIENIIRLTDGLLQNFPSVDHTESIKIDPLYVKSGDLYLDIENSPSNQKKAAQNGAYAIISEKIAEIYDSEIAWIEVDSLRLASIKLARYEFSKKNSKILFLDSISQEIIHCITRNLEFVELPSNVFRTLIIIIKSGENVKYTCSDERLALSIDPECQRIDNKFNIAALEPKSLFYSSFTCNEDFYHDIRIPSIFAKKLCMITSYLKSINIQFNLHNLSLDRHFSPIFIDYGLNKKEFGQGEKVLIFEKNMDFLDMEIRHLSSFSNKFTTCIPKRYKNYFTNHKNINLYSNIDELRDLVQKDFRHILILDKKKNCQKLFSQKKFIQKSLF